MAGEWFSWGKKSPDEVIKYQDDTDEGGYQQFQTDTYRIVNALKKSGASQAEIDTVVAERHKEFEKSQR